MDVAMGAAAVGAVVPGTASCWSEGGGGEAVMLNFFKASSACASGLKLSLIHISEPTRLALI
eukprot:1703836-Alexandrium_andersonii.AAC.1